MKELFFSVMAAILLFACNQSDSNANGLGAGSSALQQSDALTDSANFTSLQWLDSTFQDLGKVKKGQVVEIAWRFKNTGDKALVIQDVRPGCGCTVADKPEEPIGPGKESVIKGKFDSNHQNEGEHRKMLSVMANTKNSTYHQLDFRVEVTP